MAKVGLISCVSMKQNRVADASELYISPLFKKSKEYATKRLDKFFILSAKHGLLKPTDKIHPYDMTLNTMHKEERIEWAEKVFKKLIKVVSKKDEIVLMCFGSLFFYSLKTYSLFTLVVEKHRIQP